MRRFIVISWIIFWCLLAAVVLPDYGDSYGLVLALSMGVGFTADPVSSYLARLMHRRV